MNMEVEGFGHPESPAPTKTEKVLFSLTIKRKRARRL